MRLLLDTHVFLWAVTGSRLLKADARTLIENADEVYVSTWCWRNTATLSF